MSASTARAVASSVCDEVANCRRGGSCPQESPPDAIPVKT